MSTVKFNKFFRLSNVIFVILLISRLTMIVSLALENETIERACSYIFMIFGLSLFLIRFLMNIKHTHAILIFVLFQLFHQVLRSNSKSIINVFGFILMVTVWESAKSIKMTKKLGKSIVFTEVIQGIILIYISFTSLAYKGFVEGTKTSDLLTLGFANPNQTGIILFSSISILLMSVKKYVKRKSLQFFIYCEVIYLFYLLFKTGSRTSILAAAIIVIAMLFKLDVRSLKKHNVVVNAIPIMQLPFCFIYIGLSQIKSLAKLEFMEKNLFSGREELYTNVLEIWSDYIYGNVNWFMFRNSHNAALTILVNIGIIGFAIYIIYTLIELNKVYNICYRGKGIYAMLSILALFMLGYTEAAVLVTGSYYYINLLIFITIALNSSYYEESIEKLRGGT